MGFFSGDVGSFGGNLLALGGFREFRLVFGEVVMSL